jgi:hypothetical protein
LQVFSVVNGVISLDLISNADSEIVDWEKSIAKSLVQLKHAVAVDEPYCSKMDNEERQLARAVAVSQAAVYRQKE